MLRINYPFKNQILACGVQNPAGFCLAKKEYAYVINNFGSLSDEGTLTRYQQEIERWQEELKINPKIITHDLDSQGASAKYARDISQKKKSLRCLPVQHHHAHIASCLGENMLNEQIIAVVFDGAGIGEDGQIWGGEFFVGNLEGFKRVAHLQYIPLPSVNNVLPGPWQQTASFLYQAFGEGAMDLEIDFLRLREKINWDTFKQNLANPLYGSSASLLFDCVFMLCGLHEKLDYEGQGVVELERIINRSSHVAGKVYEFALTKKDNQLVISPQPILHSIVADLKNDISKSIISAAFHNAVVEMAGTVCEKVSRSYKIKDVVLTGSVFQNKFLFKQAQELLDKKGFRVITHRHFICNDTNISFGQAVLANTRQD